MKKILVMMVFLPLFTGCTPVSMQTPVVETKQPEPVVVQQEPTESTLPIGWPTQYLYQEATVCMQSTAQQGMPPALAFNICSCIFDNLQARYKFGDYMERKLKPNYRDEIIEITKESCAVPMQPQKQINDKDLENQETIWVNGKFNI